MRTLVVILILLSSSAIFSACSLLDKKQKAGLQVVTDQVDSAIFINDTYLEKTPLVEKNLQPGTYTLRIQPDNPDYVPHETTVNLRPGTLTVVTWKPGTRAEFSGGVIYELEPLKNKSSAEISVVTIPDGAIVTLAGREKEFSPVLYTNVEPGHNSLNVTLPSYEFQEYTVDVAQGYRMLVTVKLAKENPNGAGGIGLSDLDSSETATSSTNTETSAATQSARTQQLAGQSSSEVSLPRIRINSTNFFQNGEEVLRIRNLPGANGRELGFAQVGSFHPYLEETTTGWHKISFQGEEGWASGQYTTLEE